MCLNIGQYKTRKEARNAKIELVKIAKKDIPVYKVLEHKDQKYLSPYQAMEYEKGYRYDEKQFRISLIKPRLFKNFWRLEGHIGLHCYNSLKAAHDSRGSWEKVIRMYIPKGAKYVEGMDNQIMSESLVWY